MNTPTKSQTWNERYRKNKAHIGAYIDKDLKRRVDEIAAGGGLSVTAVMVRALKELLARNPVKKK